MEALANAEYVPECIKRLNSTENVQRVFEYECLPTIGDPELFCKTFPVTMATSTAEVTDRESTIVNNVSLLELIFGELLLIFTVKGRSG